MAISHEDEKRERSDEAGGTAREQPGAIDAPPTELLAAPLEFLFAEHLRQRQLANLLELIADGVINRRTIGQVIKFVEVDLAQHILDEEVSFFPLLRPLCAAEDRVDNLLRLLADEHREDENATEDAVRILGGLAKGAAVSESEAEFLRSFASRLKRHLALENGVLLPLARARMTAEALRLLSLSMAERRGGANRRDRPAR